MSEGSVDTVAADQQTDTGAVYDLTRNKFEILDTQADTSEAEAVRNLEAVDRQSHPVSFIQKQQRSLAKDAPEAYTGSDWQVSSASDEERNENMSRQLLAKVNGMSEGSVDTVATDQQTDTGAVYDLTRGKFEILDSQADTSEAEAVRNLEAVDRQSQAVSFIQKQQRFLAKDAPEAYTGSDW